MLRYINDRYFESQKDHSSSSIQKGFSKFSKFLCTARFIVDNASLFHSIVPKTFNSSHLESLHLHDSSVSLPDRMCNELSFTVFCPDHLKDMRKLVIGDYSFNNVTTLRLKSFPYLKTLRIGKHCFSHPFNQNSDSFTIADCPQLRSIVIKEWSFMHCAGKVQFSELRHLKTIKIGTIGEKSFNFINSSLVIKSMYSLQVTNRSGKSLYH